MAVSDGACLPERYLIDPSGFGRSSNRPSPTARVRKAKIRPVFDEQFSQMGVVGDNIDGPRLDLCEYSGVKYSDSNAIHGY